MCFSRTVTGLARSSAPHSWSRDRSNSLTGEFWANVAVPLTVCCPALILSELFALGLGIPKIWPFLRTATCAFSPAALLLAGCKWRELAFASSLQSNRQQGGSGGMSGMGLPSSTALSFPLFQADFFLPCQTPPCTESCQHFSERRFPSLQSLTETVWTLRSSLWLSPKQHTHRSQPLCHLT